MITKRKWPWIAQQNWNDVLFIHTPVPCDRLRSFVPYPFEIDKYNGKGWVSIVLFQATQSRLRLMPEILSYPRFLQMNIRTYVRFGSEPGVYFFSINADDRIVQLGGSAASMPLSKAHMTMQEKEDKLDFTGKRLFGRPESELQVTYKPESSVFTPESDSLPYFLSERYCIWMFQRNTIVKAPIFHEHWHLQHADVSINRRKNFPFPLTGETNAYYTDLMHSHIHPFEKVAMFSGG